MNLFKYFTVTAKIRFTQSTKVASDDTSYARSDSRGVGGGGGGGWLRG